PPRILEKNGEISATEIGGLLKQLRTQGGIKPKEIYHGLCDKGTYSRIESGAIKQPTSLLLNSLFQRLSFNINNYFTIFLTRDEFEETQLYKQIRHLLNQRKPNEAAPLIRELAQGKFYSQGFGVQYLMLVEDVCIRNQDAGANFQTLYYKLEATHIERTLQAIKITIPDFNEEKICIYRFTEIEFLLVNQLAMIYCHANEVARGVNIFKQMKENLRVTGDKGSPTFITLTLHNLSHFMCALGPQVMDEILQYAKEGERYALHIGEFKVLPQYAITQAATLAASNRKDEGTPFLPLAYYGSYLNGNMDNHNATRGAAKELWNIDFE
ncbi:MAG: hypothetical protein FWB87_00005, partial [Defluviitaleaceae bacterium]|nr:hypothetical protein [Defluviitaleaceae bacterium]